MVWRETDREREIKLLIIIYNTDKHKLSIQLFIADDDYEKRTQAKMRWGFTNLVVRH